jgi:pimeloyl-ACP methyl ester carboxylesterase
MPMTMISAKDGVKLHVEEAGEGTPILFIHEFGGNHASWEPQLRYFSRRHRCISYAARGYPPSEVPDSMEAYSQAIAADDAVAVLDALEIQKAHIVGLSMGGFCTVHFGLRTPERALSLTVAGAGYGCEKEFEEHFRGVSLEVPTISRSRAPGHFPRSMRSVRAGCSSRTRIRAAGRNSPIASPPIPIAAPPTPCAAYRRGDRPSTTSKMV